MPMLIILYLAVLILTFVGIWKTFTKAGEPGWAAIIPIYNVIVLLRVAGKDLWWIVLFFIPFVNYIAHLLVSLAVAEQFGKGAGFGVGLWLLPMIFYPILGLGSAQYGGAAAAPAAARQAPPPPPLGEQGGGTPPPPPQQSA